ncbi:unnamed protein product, partial [Ixodes pacificus]
MRSRGVSAVVLVVAAFLLISQLVITVRSAELEREEQFAKVAFGGEQEEAGMWNKIKSMPKKLG